MRARSPRAVQPQVVKGDLEKPAPVPEGMSGSKARRSLFAGVLPSVSLLASGCGGSKSPSVASLGTTTPSSAASRTNAAGGAAGSGSPSSQVQLQQGLLNYAECMRSSGVPNFPDPKAGGGFEIPLGSGIDPSSPVFKAAQVKCRSSCPAAARLAPARQRTPPHSGLRTC